MKVSYNWLKWYIPDAPAPEKLADLLTYHLAEVETVEKREDGDYVLDIKILPNRGHDLLSHMGMAKEISSLLNLSYVDPAPKYKVPESKPTTLQILIETPACKRYMGRIVRNITMGPSPEWMKVHLESIGQRSINNIVDATNIVMFDCGEPTHVFDLDKIKGSLTARLAKDGEIVTTLDGKDCTLTSQDFIVADDEKPLIIGGVKGGKAAEVDGTTKDIVLEVGNFDATTVRKTSTRIGIRTEGSKRWENNISPELAPYGMVELSALIAEMCPDATFEDVVDIYPVRQGVKRLSFSVGKISKILGAEIASQEIEDILKRYGFEYRNDNGNFEMVVPSLRLDLVTEEDVAEEIGRVMGYDKLLPKLPQINFVPKPNEIYAKISWARNKLLDKGYSEVMTYTFSNKGEVQVLASASDKKFLRTNLSDGLKESLKLNHDNAPLLGITTVKVFEIGTVFTRDNEEIHIAYGDKKEIKEMELKEFCKDTELPAPGKFMDSNAVRTASPFVMWPLFPFIVRDVAVWVPEGVLSGAVQKIIKDNAGSLVVRGPELFDQFKKDTKTSYAFRVIFQSYERTLTDEEVNGIMNPIYDLLRAQPGFEIR